MTGILKVDTIQRNDGSTPTAADLGLNIAGSIVQVVSTVSSNNGVSNPTQIIATTTYTEWASLATSITKKVTSSKIICVSSIMLGLTAAQWSRFKVLRNNSTQIWETSTYDNAAYGSGIENKSIYNFIDDTSAISAGTQLTYNFYASGSGASNNIQLNWLNATGTASTSSIMLMEIAG